LPNVKIPPSAATCQYPPPLGEVATPVMGAFSGSDAELPNYGDGRGDDTREASVRTLREALKSMSPLSFVTCGYRVWVDIDRPCCL